MLILDLRDLSTVCPVSKKMLACYTEAAWVMLSKFHRPPETPGILQQQRQPVPVTVLWQPPSPSALVSHGNEKDATEEGAYAVAIAMAHALGFRVIGRLHQGSGADWFMVPIDGPASDCYKLEVSGMARAGAEKPASRLAGKLAQAAGGRHPAPRHGGDHPLPGRAGPHGGLAMTNSRQARRPGNDELPASTEARQ